MKTEKEIIDEAVEAIIEEVGFSGGVFDAHKKELRHIIAVAIRRSQALEQRRKKCRMCGGTGAHPQTGSICDDCGGSGRRT